MTWHPPSVRPYPGAVTLKLADRYVLVACYPAPGGVMLAPDERDGDFEWSDVEGWAEVPPDVYCVLPDGRLQMVEQ